MARQRRGIANHGTNAIFARPPGFVSPNVVAHSSKAVDVNNYDDMATGWRVDPEKRVNQEFNTRELLLECSTWKACEALLNESPQKFSRNHSLSYFLLAHLVDLLGPPSVEGSKALLRHVIMPPHVSPTANPAAAGNAVAADPFARGLRPPPGTTRVVGPERVTALKLVDRVLSMIVGNMDKMRADHVTGTVFCLARLSYAPPVPIKALLLYLRANTKRFKIAELYASLAALTALHVTVPASVVKAVLDQASRGMRYVTAPDLSNAVYALHDQPRGVVPHTAVGSLLRAMRPWLYDMSGPSLAFLAALLARQAYRPAASLKSTLLEALGPQLESFKDAQALSALLYGLRSLQLDLHAGITDTAERVLAAEGGMSQLEPAQLAVVGSVLSTAGDGYVPSSAMCEAYITEVEAQVEDADASAAGALLTGLAYFSQASDSLQPSAATLEELLDLVQGRLHDMSGPALLQLARAVDGLKPELPRRWAPAFQVAVAGAAPRCASYDALTALVKAAVSPAPGLALPHEAVNDFASRVATQAMTLSRGPGSGGLSLASESGDGDGSGDASELPGTQLPSQEERAALVAALESLPGVEVQELTLPDARAPPQPYFNASRRGPGGFQRGRSVLSGADSGEWLDDGMEGQFGAPALSRDPYARSGRSPAASSFDQEWVGGPTNSDEEYGLGSDWELDPGDWGRGQGAMGGRTAAGRRGASPGAAPPRAARARQVSGPGWERNAPVESWDDWEEGEGLGADDRIGRATEEEEEPQAGRKAGAARGRTAARGRAAATQVTHDPSEAADELPVLERTVDVDDGMGDGAWGVDSTRLAAQQRQRKAAAQQPSPRTSNGFANLLDDADFFGGDAGTGPAGLGSGPVPKGPGLGMFADAEVEKLLGEVDQTAASVRRAATGRKAPAATHAEPAVQPVAAAAAEGGDGGIVAVKGTARRRSKVTPSPADGAPAEAPTRKRRATPKV